MTPTVYTIYRVVKTYCSAVDFKIVLIDKNKFNNLEFVTSISNILNKTTICFHQLEHVWNTRTQCTESKSMSDSHNNTEGIKTHTRCEAVYGRSNLI